MSNEILLKTGAPQLVFADHAGDFNPAAANDLQLGSITTIEMDLASVANGDARQSDKFNFGATRAGRYDILVALEFAASGLSDGATVEFWIAWSTSVTAANANPGGVSGSNASYDGYSTNLNVAIVQLSRVGTMIVTEDASTTVQIATVGMFVPMEQYGSLVVLNRSGASLHSDDVEMHVVFNPVTDELQ